VDSAISKGSGVLNRLHSIRRLGLCFLKFWEERYHQDDEKRVLPFLCPDERIDGETPMFGQGEIRL
jgi:hypothetical protein